MYMHIHIYIIYIYGNVTVKLTVELYWAKKNAFFQNGEQESKTGLVWGLVPVGRI
jgi:hypothetical protein